VVVFALLCVRPDTAVWLEDLASTFLLYRQREIGTARKRSTNECRKRIYYYETSTRGWMVCRLVREYGQHMSQAG
jgi:hypothetical protein